MIDFARRKVYISGPITGKYESNRAAFQGMEDWLTEQGARVYNPQRNQVPKGTVKADIWSVMMRKSLEDIVKCDSIVMLVDWEDSRGAALEYQIASELAMKIYNHRLERVG